MKARGLEPPLLCIVDGNTGLRKAVGRKFAGALVQRCQVHKMLNIINKLPHLARPTLKKLIYKAFTARNHKEGMARARLAPCALEQDLEESLTALRFRTACASAPPICRTALR